MNARPSRFLLAMGIAGTLAVSGACEERSQPPIVSDILLGLDADHMTLGMDHEMTQEGVRYAHLESDTAYYYADSTSWALRRVTMKVFTSTGAERATLTSDRGTLDEETETMVARGNVVLLLPDRDGRLESEELHYDPVGKRFWSDSATVWTEGGSVSRGQGFESDLEFQDLRIRGASIRSGRIRF